ncbi:MAG: proline dehydrogenase family protein [candidate division WOR-3 bacterium]|nr:proline dehydrogenase family protein [candidate division WOR-3 bacterium]MCX7947306.1 proline dehydrogenase family protein [candidate division WOR-3 bacterium]MDW8150137.1 proline dehydrogenase family protein [candidate division WOR-3 bacterium]
MLNGVFKNLFFYLSKNRNFEKFIVSSRITKPLVNRFIAGYNLEDALKVLENLNQRGIRITIDYLGESVIDKQEVENTFLEYKNILSYISGNNSISVKLTSIGLDIDKNLTYDYLRQLVEVSNFIEIDMESSNYVDATIEIYKKIKTDYPTKKIALAIQSYLKRSIEDVNELIKYNPIIRLVKGAYKEPREIAYESKKEVDRKFIEIAEILLKNTQYTLIATHDEKIINHVKNLNIDKTKFEFQMLYGIKFELLLRLKDEGYNCGIYLPYGSQWYPYFMRRLAERPANVIFLLKNLFRK